jgi:hypothetical protein
MEQQVLQTQYRTETKEFQKTIIESVNSTNKSVDSLIILVDRNYKTSLNNRYVIIKQIKNDTGLTGAEVIELMQPFMEEIKKNSMR